MRMLTSKMVPFSVTIRELKQLRRRPQRRLQKSNRFNDQNNSSARASRFLVHFFDVHCTTTTWNLLIAVLWRTWTCDDEFSFLFLNLNKILKNWTPGKVACIWYIERVQIERLSLKERELIFSPTFSLPSSSSLLRGWGWVFSLSKHKRIRWTGLRFWWTTRKDSLITLHVLFFYFGGARSKGFPTLRNVPKLLFSEHDSARFTIRVFDVVKPDWVRNISRSLRVLSVSLGTLISNKATAMRTSLKKWICVLSVYIAIIPTHLLCQM